MKRCFHLYRNGWQCEAEAIPGSEFCEDHISEVEFERLKEDPFRRWTFRIVALILLLMFLIPFYYTVRSLFGSRTNQLQGGW